MNGLLQQNDIVADRTDVLNGIAYDSTTKNFLITGKRWPKMFEVRVAP
jgi:glutaminyl-peptide cyclotransferase